MMPLLFVCLTFCYIHFANSEELSPAPNKLEENTGVVEDQRVINETLAKYGPPLNNKLFDLPGPMVEVDRHKSLYPRKVISDEPDKYTLRVRTITEYFSYNARYEETEFNNENRTEIAIIKGQFGEHFRRESGGYYIRSIGYVVDEKGYRQFLIDLTKAETTLKKEDKPGHGGSHHNHRPPPGRPNRNKITISSTVLGTLIGGNTLG